MKEITIVSGKGGTGKTSLLAAFTALSKDTVVADCDVDASNLHLLLEPEIIKERPIIGSLKADLDQEKCIKCDLCRQKCRFNAIDEDINIHPEICEGCGVCEFICPVDAIELVECEAGLLTISKTRFGKFSHVKMYSGEEGSGKLVTAVRKQARDIAESEGMDTILVDGPPGIGCPVIASLTGADLAVIVCETSLSGLHDLKRVNILAEKMDVPVAICINKSDVNNQIKSDIEAYASELSIPVLGEVPYSLDFVDSMLACKSIVEWDTPLRETVIDIWNNIEEMLRP